MTEEPPVEPLRSQRFGWPSLFLWALVGAGLEAAHGFKVSSVLDDELGRTLLRLGHAHGVGLSLVVLAYAAAGAPLLGDNSRKRVGLMLRVAAVLVPAGFLFSAFGHPEGDPGLAIFLVPLGALSLLAALGELSIAALRRG